ncbi:hypothetical protein E1B28_007007 [Marasmius oreades]|uniref:Uncharacterized protein n=1 Tax=Marasmius oreades TaxID=181124 RepID=A0A9P7S0Y0_9AGAR|nr:uncharacterized protein E1B28_007007 [Marasmius oreades]KAG7093327.1 hypothetical protein E1B28_007007 [Marasmius oreades]
MEGKVKDGTTTDTEAKKNQDRGEGEGEIKKQTVTTVHNQDGDGTVTTTTTTTVIEKVVETTKEVVGIVGVGGEGDDAPSCSSTADDDRGEGADLREVTGLPVTISEDDSIFLGLKVYTKKEAPVEISGQLRHEMEVSLHWALMVK